MKLVNSFIIKCQNTVSSEEMVVSALLLYKRTNEPTKQLNLETLGQLQIIYDYLTNEKTITSYIISFPCLDLSKLSAMSQHASTSFCQQKIIKN